MSPRKMIARLVVFIVASLAAAAPAVVHAQPEPRPQVAALRLDEAQVLSAFTEEVRKRPDLRERAILLWRSQFAADASVLRDRFLREADWRPAFADAAALLDEFLETSLLPRAGERYHNEDTVKVETLDPRTGQRKVMYKQVRRGTFIAPQDGEDKDKDGATPGKAKAPLPKQNLRPAAPAPTR